MSRPARISLCLALVLPALALSACGGDEEATIPQSNSEALLEALADVEQSVAEDNCTAAQTNASQFVLAVNALPKEVGAETKDQLREAGSNLVDLTADPAKCGGEEPEEEPVDPETGASGEEGFEG